MVADGGGDVDDDLDGDGGNICGEGDGDDVGPGLLDIIGDGGEVGDDLGDNAERCRVTSGIEGDDDALVITGGDAERGSGGSISSSSVSGIDGSELISSSSSGRGGSVSSLSSSEGRGGSSLSSSESQLYSNSQSIYICMQFT